MSVNKTIQTKTCRILHVDRFKFLLMVTNTLQKKGLKNWPLDSDQQ
jgi:hypothetical protein